MRISFVVNAHRGDAVRAATEAAQWLIEHGAEVGAEAEMAPHLGLEAYTDAQIPQADLVMSFGGDGTLIRAAHLCSELGTPILGVYYGTFGFVTQCDADEVGAALSMVIDGNAQVEERMMIQTELIRGTEPVITVHALNEMILQRAATARMMVANVAIDGHHVTTYPADGVMVSTPTGSTAYNLSVGGPIVDPRMRAMILTALAPHTLSARPLILRPESRIELGLQTEGDAVISIDGQTRLHVLSGDRVVVQASNRVTRLISVERDDFLEKLSHRLFYGLNAAFGGKR